MAVEIPVIIDIEKAFEDASKRVKTAMQPLQRSVEDAKVNVPDFFPQIGEALKKLELARDRVRELTTELKGLMTKKEAQFTLPFDVSKVDRAIDALLKAQASLSTNGFNQYIEGLSRADFELLQMAEHYKALEISSMKMSDSINGYRARMADLNEQWNRMTSAERNSAEGKAIYQKYKKEATALREVVLTLDEKMAKEQAAANATIKSQQRAAQSRKYETAILNSTITTLKVLQEQERILSDRLARTPIGTSKYNQLKSDLDAVRTKLQSLTGSVGATTNALRTQGTVLQSLTSYASMYFSAFGVLRFAKQIRDVTAELEYQRISLGRLIQDEEYGAYLFEKIKAAAVESPFRIKDLVTYTKQLAAYKIEQENLFDVTKRLADISAGLGVDMNRLILAYGQVRAASVLRGQELRQFTEAGIPLVELLAEKMGELNQTTYSTADVFKLISERAVPFSAIADIFEDLTDKGGMFYKMQEEQANTLRGRWEKLKDTYDIALQSIGESKGILAFTTYNDLILGSLKALANGIRIIPKLLEGATVAWIAYSIATMKSRRAIRADAIATAENTVGKNALAIAQKRGIKYTDAYSAAMVRSSVASTALGRSLWKLWAAMIANPWGAAIAGVLGLVTAFLTFRKNTDSSVAGLVEYKKAVEDIAQAEKKYSKTGGLIEQYEKLASKTERTEEENRRLYNTMQRLNDLFPELKLGIDKENDSLEENARLLRQKNDAEVQRARAEAEQSLKAAELNREQQRKLLAQQIQDRADAYDKMVEIRETRNIDYAPAAKKEYEDALKRYNELDAAVQETRDSIVSLDESIASLNEYLHPVTEELTGWRKEVKELNNYKTSLGSMQIFTPAEIDGMESVYDLFKKLKKEWTDAKTSVEGLEAAYAAAADTMAKTELFTELEDSKSHFSQVDAMRAFFGFDFTRPKGGSGYTQDPFIKTLQDRMKFMKDFQKGYDDFRKAFSKSMALGKESEIMLTRGLALGLGADEQKRAAEDLSKWYEDTINSTFDYLKSKKGVTGSLQEFLSKEITGKTNRDKMLKDFQGLLQSLFDAKTDFDTSKMKKEIEDAMKKLSDEIKRSETARNFYQDILGLTGDEQLAATLGVSIYGDIGKEFNERLQEELNKALETLDAGSITDELRKAFSTQNFSVILENLDKFPEEWQKRLKEMAASSEKFQADMVKNLLKSLEKFKSYGDQQVELSKQTARRTANIQALNIPQAQKNKLLEQNARKEAEESAKIAYEAFRDTPMYIELFDDLDAASTRMLENMRKNLEDMRENWKALSPRELKELQSKINDLDEQIAKKNPFKALISSIKEYRDLQKGTTRREAESAAIEANDEMVRNKEILELYQKQYEEAVARYGIESKEAKQAEENLEVQAIVTDLAIENAKAAQKTASAFKESGDRILKAAEGLETWSGYITDSLGGVEDIVSTFASDDVAETFGIISDGIGKTVSGATDLAKGLGKILTGDIVGGVVSAIKGAGDFIAGTFGAASKLKIKALDKEIEKQSRLIDDLSYSYSRLENAMAKSFGSEYIYNYSKQLENLAAQAEAYRAQAEAEQSKGKKQDKDKVREYLNSARDAEDQIAEMRTQLSEFFSGTDLTSAAEDFANSWIEAYKEFGSTTDAMSEKFNEMINSMINRSLAAKIMQEMLQPVFDQIDTMAGDGLLATDEIAAISALAQERIPLINEAMTNLMTSLASAGLDVRASTAGFHGISKDIANASEESILGLAAAINTQNFYISYVPTISENVSQILAAMTGGVSPTAPVETNEAGEVLPSVQRMVYEHLPNMDANLSEMLRLFRSVITTKTGSTNTNYVAIK